MIGEDLNGPSLPPSLYLSYDHFQSPPLEKEDRSTWSQTIDTIAEIAALGFISFAEVKINKKTETISDLILEKPDDRIYYFKTYTGPLQYTKEISKQQFQRELEYRKFFFTEQHVDTVEKSFPYAGTTLSISLSIEARLHALCKLDKILVIPAILMATAYKPALAPRPF